MDRPNLVCGNMDCFQFLTTVNKAFMNICVRTSLCMNIYFHSEGYLRVEVLCHMLSVYFTLF